MKKYLWFIIISVCVVFAVVAMVMFIWQRQATDSVPATDRTIMADNELVILHLNTPVTTSTSGLTLTLVEHAASTVVTVAAQDGTDLGRVTFSAVDQTQSLGEYRFRLRSTTANAVQVVIFSPTAS